MARWQGGARERLREAALGLFGTQGYDGTTVAEIAAAAGVTERTFFRYYADKREVLFVDQTAFEQAFLAGLPPERDDAGLPPDDDDAGLPADGDDPMRLIAAVLDSAAGLFPEERRPWSRARQKVITANVALQERELLKMSALAVTLTGALTARGADPTSAALAAESGVTVFRTAFSVWVTPDEQRTFLEIQQAVLARLHTLIGQ
ncbi:MAG TPA: TetR family transcriptional regulator [Actinoplanes sp.]|nr:TetR family transcriptional regulator [Actinoplanes sp.]